MRVTVKTVGLAELEKALAELPRATAKRVVQRTLLQAAQPIVDRARALVPVRSGGLRDSIQAKLQSKGGAGKAAYAAAMRSGAGAAGAVAAMRDAQRGSSDRSTTEVVVGPGQMPHAHLQEFGTQNHGPQPYLRPAWDENKQKALDSIGEIMGAEIMKAARRAANKALKARGR